MISIANDSWLFHLYDKAHLTVSVIVLFVVAANRYTVVKGPDTFSNVSTEQVLILQ